MLEYIFDAYFMILYFIALILSIVKYHLYYNSILKYLPILIAYTFLTETLGLIVKEIKEIQIIYQEDYNQYNAIIFNFFDIVFFIYFFYIYYHAIDNSLHQKTLKYGCILFIISSILNLFIQDFYIDPQNYSIIIGSILLLYSTGIYLNKIYKEAYKSYIHTNLLFWISIGIFFFYLFYPITMYLLTYRYDFFMDYNIINYHHASIGVLYMCFIIGFYLMKRFRIPMKRKSITNNLL